MGTRTEVDLSEFEELVAALRGAMPKAAHGALLGAAAIPVGEIKLRMAAAKHGRRYGDHIASAPGEAPAIDIGELAGSVRVLGGAYSPIEAWVEFGSDVPHAAYTEMGTSRMAPRPWLVSTTMEMEVRRAINRAFAQSLRAFLRRFGGR